MSKKLFDNNGIDNIDDLIDELVIEDDSIQEEIEGTPSSQEVLSETTLEDKLGILGELFIKISQFQDTDMALNIAIDGLKKIIPYKACTILSGDKVENFESLISRTYNFELLNCFVDAFKKDGVFDWSANSKKPILLEERIGDLKLPILIIPLILENNLYGMVLLFLYENQELTKGELDLAKVVAAQFTAIMAREIVHKKILKKDDELEMNLARISAMYEELYTLYNLGKEFRTVFSKPELLKRTIELCVKSLNVNKVIIFEKHKQKFVIVEVYGLKKKVKKGDYFKKNYLFKKICTSKAGLLIEDLSKIDEESLKNLVFLDKSISTLVATPVVLEKKVRFVILAFDRKDFRRFNKNNQQLLNSIAIQFGNTLERIFLYEQFLEKERIQHDIEIAGEIQNRLLPSVAPAINGYSIFGKSLACEHVGGDYFDYIQVSENKYCFLVADVSGHGIPAGLIMTTLRAITRTIFTQADLPLNEALNKIAMMIYRDVHPDRFITIAILLVDFEKHQGYIVNAGHNPLIFYTKDTFNKIFASNMPVGIFQKIEYKVESLNMAVGDMIVLYTDGIIEARKAKTEWGMQNFEKELRNNINKIENNSEFSKKTVENILKAVASYTDETDDTDDRTILIIRRYR